MKVSLNESEFNKILFSVQNRIDYILEREFDCCQDDIRIYKSVLEKLKFCEINFDFSGGVEIVEGKNWTE